jgi:Zn-dependent peptidase ImmA (M78 family)
MLAEIPAEQVRDAVEGVAREILAEAAILGPPVDAVLLAQRLGLIVARDAAVEVRARFLRLGGASSAGQPTILVADDPRPERQQWAVAHEVGENHAHRVFAELGVDPVEAGPGAREATANRLAGCLLLPREWFLADGAALSWDLFELKARYATASHEMVARRMLEMPLPVIITLWDEDRQQWRRGNSLGRTPPLTPAERDARQAAHDLSEAVQCDAGELPDGVEDVRAWPVHEPLWKREIIRTRLADQW